MRWALVGLICLGSFAGASALAARQVGGWRQFEVAVHEDGFPVRWYVAAVAVSVLSAVAIDPLESRSFRAGEWFRTGFVFLWTNALCAVALRARTRRRPPRGEGRAS